MTNTLHEPGLNELLYAIGILIVRAIEKRIDKKKAEKCRCEKEKEKETKKEG